MKLALAIASTFAIVVAESPSYGAPTGGFGAFGGAGGYSLGGGNNVGGGGGGGSGPSSGYGAPGFGGANSFGGGSGGSAPSSSYGSPSQGGGAGYPGGAPAPDASQAPQVFRYVSVHTAPVDPDDEGAKVIKIPGGNNKHVNIIFVKAPSNGADQKTEVVLPEPDEHKNLVYVLVQKTEPGSNLKIRKPQATKPPKPEVYFIRYKSAPQQAGQSQGGPGSGGAGGIGGYSRDASIGSGYGAPPPSSGYGAP